LYTLLEIAARHRDRLADQVNGDVVAAHLLCDNAEQMQSVRIPRLLDEDLAVVDPLASADGQPDDAEWRSGSRLWD